MRKPRIILISARRDAELEERARAAGADWCLAKPFDLDLLKMAVGALLAAPENTQGC